MAWRGELAAGPDDRLELTFALRVRRNQSGLLMVVKDAPGGKLTELGATGLYWSDAMAAPYVYFPPGEADGPCTLSFSFRERVASLTIDVLQWPSRTPLGPADCAGVMSTVYRGEDGGDVAVVSPWEWVAA